jgi:hypothetical protein
MQLMLGDTLTITLDEPLATKVRVAAEACGLSVDEWVEMAMKRRAEIERCERTFRLSNSNQEE